MGIFVYITLGQGHSNISKTLLIIYESFVLRSVLSQIVDLFSWGPAKTAIIHLLFASRCSDSGSPRTMCCPLKIKLGVEVSRALLMMASRGNGLNLPYIGKSLLASVELLVLAVDLMFTPCLIYCTTFMCHKKPHHQTTNGKKKEIKIE